MTISVATLGFPRIGPRRELKFALESFLVGQIRRRGAVARRPGPARCRLGAAKGAGCRHRPQRRFLALRSRARYLGDARCGAGALWLERRQGRPRYVLPRWREAQGAKGHEGCAHGLDSTAQEMTKWFDTNYHYMVPELSAGQAFALSSSKAVDEFLEAKALGYHTRPVLLGPVTYLDARQGQGCRPVVAASMRCCRCMRKCWRSSPAPAPTGCRSTNPAWCSISTTSSASRCARRTSAFSVNGPKVMLATYFGALGDNLELATDLPVHGLHIDLVRAPEQLDAVRQRARPDLLLPLGVIDGRNVWRADLDALIERIAPVAAERNLVLAPSCSLLHVPVDLAIETALDPEVKQWLAFAVQKIGESSVLAQALNRGAETVAEPLALGPRGGGSAQDLAADPQPGGRGAARGGRSRHEQTHLALCRIVAGRSRRGSACRASRTTTIGSFPADAGSAQARAAHIKGEIDDLAYEQFLRIETAATIEWQEKIGLDVLVHGEFERNDMVQYFGEQLSRLCLHLQRLGAELWLALRAAADPLRRCRAAEADDGRLVALCPIA